MKSTNTCSKTLAAICLLALLGGCGGEDDKKKGCKNKRTPLGQAFCYITSDAGKSQGDTSKDSGVTGIPTASFGEYEPNNILDNANTLALPVHGSGTTAIAGSVHKDTDGSDFFVFTPSRTGSYRFSLCEGICDEAAEDDAVYLMVYDQTQSTIASTPIGTPSAKEVSADLAAGMAYYVEINGYNADAFAYNYRLTVSGD